MGCRSRKVSLLVAKLGISPFSCTQYRTLHSACVVIMIQELIKVTIRCYQRKAHISSPAEKTWASVSTVKHNNIDSDFFPKEGLSDHDINEVVKMRTVWKASRLSFSEVEMYLSGSSIAVDPFTTFIR